MDKWKKITQSVIILLLIVIAVGVWKISPESILSLSPEVEDHIENIRINTKDILETTKDLFVEQTGSNVVVKSDLKGIKGSLQNLEEYCEKKPKIVTVASSASNKEVPILKEISSKIDVTNEKLESLDKRMERIRIPRDDRIVSRLDTTNQRLEVLGREIQKLRISEIKKMDSLKIISLAAVDTCWDCSKLPAWIQ